MKGAMSTALRPGCPALFDGVRPLPTEEQMSPDYVPFRLKTSFDGNKVSVALSDA
jgi:hypothetical protein